MSTIVPLSRERHANQRWTRFTSYAFASRTSLVPVVDSEIPKAAMALPLAFAPQGESYVPVAVMGLDPGHNLLVASDGRWLGRYIPSALRGYPFSLMRAEGETLVLCVDEGSGLLVEGHDGEPLFDAEGAPTEGVRKVLEFLQHIEHSRVRTTVACDALARHGLIKPWPISLQSESGERRLEGLFQVDETALNQASDPIYLELRQAAALSIAYCQLLSMQNLSLLVELPRTAISPPPAASGAGSFVLPEEALLQFDWDR